MKISFSPTRGDAQPKVSVEGDVLTINGDALDLSVVPEGAVLPAGAVASGWIAGPITRAGGELSVTILLPHGADAPEATRFPAPVTVTSGPVPLPAYENPTEEQAE